MGQGQARPLETPALLGVGRVPSLTFLPGQGLEWQHPIPKEPPLIELKLPDMSCGHCASTITQTCKLVDPAAKVQVDLAGKRVCIESAEDRKDFEEALAEAGYPASA